MISILGTGSAYGRTVLNGSLLQDIDPSLREKSESLSKLRLYSCLSPAYLKETGNRDVSEAVNNTVQSVTDLALEAADKALASAGITKEQIGLIIGDCATPIETIPSESQRLANKLAIKVPCYDMLSGSAAFLNFFDALQNWSEERTPEYILCISSNAPTQRVDYRSGRERFFFSDAAAAVVVSGRQPGVLNLSEVNIDRFVLPRSAVDLYLYEHIRVDWELLHAYLKRTSQLLSDPADSKTPRPAVLPVPVPAEFHQENELLEYFSGSFKGYSLGSTAFCILAENWANIRNHDTLCIPIVGLETRVSGSLIWRASKGVE